MGESRAPRGAEWADVGDALHGLANVMSVRSHYAEGHPAIARADAAAASGFSRLLDRVPEIVLALLDGEFVVSERPLPELRARLTTLAEAMTRHELECIVFQRGITPAECALLGRTLNLPTVSDPAKLREETQTGLAHVLLRFAELKSSAEANRQGARAEYFVPEVGLVLHDAARAIAAEKMIDRTGVRAIARRLVDACNARVFALEPRAYAVGVGDEASHATNVALMTAAMTLEAGYSEHVCVEAASAALLHDVGQFFLPQRIRGIPEPLIAEPDKARFRDHSTIGALALLAAGAPPLWVATALDHHRGVDGGGYPALESKSVPHEIVRMISLASFVDRRRTLVNGLGDEPDEALRRAIALEDRYFGRTTVRVFVRALGVYPPGTFVELSNRELAIVVNANPGDPLRPQVRPLFGDDAGRRIDLKALNAVEDRHVHSIARAVAPPLVVREPDVVPAIVEPDPPPVATPSTPAPRFSDRPRTLPPRTLPPRSIPPIPREDHEETAAAPASLPPDAIPALKMAPAELLALDLDPRAGFILSFIDGATSIEMIYDLCGLPRDDAARLLADLVARGVVAIT